MARVKAKILCFVDNGLRQPGEMFQYDGPYNKNLEYLDKKLDVEPEPDVQVDAVAVRRPGRPRKTASVNENG